MRVAVTEPGHANAAGEVEEFAAVISVEPAAFAMIDGDIPPAVSRHNGCNQGISPARGGLRKAGRRPELSSSPERCRSGPADLPPIPAQIAGIAHHRHSPRHG